MQISVKDLSYVYSEKSKSLAVHALDKVNLTIEEGSFLGIIGHTGSGKSTFIQHLNGLIKLEKDKGSIKIGEFDLAEKNCDFRLLRSKLGMVFQYPEYQLFAETVFEDVAFGIKNFMPETTPEQTEEMVKNALETVGLNYYAVKDRSPFELSGGQKRRVAIAGVIVTKPEVLVLDEPVAGLDPVGKKEFIALLKQLHNSFVKTIIIVSHDLNLVAENCDKVAVFSQGKVVATGTPKEIFSNEQKVSELGLKLPVTATLEKALNGVGVDLNSDLTEDGFVRAFTEFYKGGNG
ncbi:MAG: energy-coupling factor transporter ATPase [Clostridia bacterium]|nr:energy-coupling factor transporter ATPase [Clostridia bacterium]